MGFKGFRLIVTGRVLLLTLTLAGVVLLFNTRQHYLSASFMLILSGLQVYGLIRYVGQTNRRLSMFFHSIRYTDFSASFIEEGMGTGFDELGKALNDVIREFQHTRIEKEEQHNYLQTVVQHVNTGILTFRRDGLVDMYNNAMRRLFNTGHIHHLHDLEKVNPELPDNLLRIRAGDRLLLKLFIDQEVRQLLMYATEFKMRKEEYVLVAMQDIHAELEEKETESWQNLIRVLTHEIMNSMTPISSLASTVKGMLNPGEEGEEPELDEDDKESIRAALSTIQNRSDALLNFVGAYRNLTRIPKPNFRRFSIREMFERGQALLAPRLEEMNVDLQMNIIPDNLMLTADPDLVDQVLINLLLNAIDALKTQESRRIWLRATEQENGKIVIEVADSGHGITPDILDKIFMPFFTSKREGSGIGLSLSRQIMRLHKGSISVKSTPGEGAVFFLVF